MISYSIYLNESATNICSVIESFLRLFCEFKPIALIHFGFCRTNCEIRLLANFCNHDPVMYICEFIIHTAYKYCRVFNVILQMEII